MEEREKRYRPCTGEHDFCARGLPPSAGKEPVRAWETGLQAAEKLKNKNEEKIKKVLTFFLLSVILSKSQVSNSSQDEMGS